MRVYVSCRFCFFFFFSSRRRHTRCSRDWSSDVCSSDLKQGRFREDLYYRLAVVTMRLPKLAERGDDLVLLTAYFVRQFADRYGKRITAISDRALDLLRNHTWVGNVRELRNVPHPGVEIG